MKALDQRVQEAIDVDELEADFFRSYGYAEKVILIRTQVYFARPSAVPSLVASQSTEAPSPDSAVIRHGNTAAFPGEDNITVEADKVENVHAACEPCVCDLIGDGDSNRTEQLAKLATDFLDGQLGVPSSLPSDDCAILADANIADLSKEPVTTMCKDAAGPDRPNLIFFDGSDVAAACGGFLLKHRVGDHRERASFPLAGRWP